MNQVPLKRTRQQNEESERTKRARKTYEKIVTPKQMTGSPKEVFENTFTAVQQSNQWATASLKKREQLFIKSWTKVLKVNSALWFSDDYLSVTTFSTPVTTSTQALESESDSEFEPTQRQKEKNEEVIPVPSNEFKLANSDVRLEIYEDKIKFVKQKKYSIYQKSVTINHKALSNICSVTNKVVKYGEKLKSKIAKNLVNLKSNDLKIIVDSINSVFIAVSIFDENVLIHIRRYLKRGMQNGLVKFTPTKEGITITPDALLDLNNRVLKIIEQN